MVSTAAIKLLPYFYDTFPVRPRIQRPGSTSQPVPRKAFDNAGAVHQYTPNPTRMADHSFRNNNDLHTYNAKRQVVLRTIQPAGRVVDTYAWCLDSKRLY